MRTLPALCALALFVLPALAQDPVETVPDEASGRCPAIPGDDINLTPLTDPFTFANGRPVRTRQDWACRRAEIAEFVQRYQLGKLPTSRPKVEGVLSGTTLNVTVTDNNATISFTASIRNVPEGDGPFPAIIGVGAASIPIPEGVATISYVNDRIAEQQNRDSRGKGLFYDLYGADHPAGAQIAWAWGVSRLIDALEQVQKESRINPKRLGVTGCSRNGKGTLVIGAFEPRIALTIPQEGGAGGTSCWRIQDALYDRGVSTQTPRQIVTENVWLGRVFDRYVNKVGVLPYDQHLLTALIAPRAIYSAEKGHLDWLGPESSWGCQRAARSVWRALGVEDHIGYEQTSSDYEAPEQNHCQFPVSLQEQGLNAFIDRFLKDKRVRTSQYFRTLAKFSEYKDSFWIKWETPRLR